MFKYEAVGSQRRITLNTQHLSVHVDVLHQSTQYMRTVCILKTTGSNIAFTWNSKVKGWYIHEIEFNFVRVSLCLSLRPPLSRLHCWTTTRRGCQGATSGLPIHLAGGTSHLTISWKRYLLLSVSSWLDDQGHLFGQILQLMYESSL